MPSQPATDKEQPIEGQPLDIGRLVAEHHQVVYRYAYRLCGRVQDAEDLAQQTFLTAQQKLDQVRSASKVRGWLLVVTRNCYLKSLRRKVPLLAGELDLDVNLLPETTGASDDQIDQEQLQQAIDELADEFKVVVVMFYFEQCSYKEIAEQLKLPLGTVMSRLSRAKRHLRDRLFCQELT